MQLVHDEGEHIRVCKYPVTFVYSSLGLGRLLVCINKGGIGVFQDLEISSNFCFRISSISWTWPHPFNCVRPITVGLSIP